jgi:phosphatidylinositol glycan class A protein
LEEHRIDDETTEYTVRRVTSHVIARALLPAWIALALLATVANTCAVDGPGGDHGGGSKKTSTHFAVFAFVLASVWTLRKTVISESAMIMRHVGVRLTTRNALSSCVESIAMGRFMGSTHLSRFLDVDRLRSVAIHEVVRAKAVETFLCFRVVENDRRVVLVFPNLKPGVPILRNVYRRAHEALFEDDALGETVDTHTPREPRTAAEDSDAGSRESRDAADFRGRRCLPGPAAGFGWWRGPDGEGQTDGEHVSSVNASVFPGIAAPGDSPARERNRESILMVSDFFLPNLGGVELHMYSLAQRLLRRGHRVTVLTHAYGDRCGVRYMTNGLKVYYAFRVPVYNGSTCPDIFGNFKLLRSVLLRERITILHAHQAFSVMAHEAIFHGRTMGYKCVFTDHSLFGFSDTSAIHMNKLLVFTLSDCNHVKCVSHTAKENTVLRSGVPPLPVSVVPNAVDSARFRPDASLAADWDPASGNRNDTRPERTRVTIAVTARLAYRKGVHVLADVIPSACATFEEVDFLVAGDGPMRPHLEAMLAEKQLHGRVTLLGNVPHREISDVLRRAQIFLNCSLTESFCIAILEAACCGCLVVATKVGGVPEVLPPDLLFLAEADPEALVDAIGEALLALRSRDASRTPTAIHERVRAMYSWDDVAERVEKVYERAHRTRDTMNGRLARLRTCGVFAGVLFCAVAAVDYLYWRWVEFSSPGSKIDAALEYVPDGEEEKKEEEEEA